MSDSNWLPHPLRCVTLFTHYEMISPSICQSRIFERIKIGVIEKIVWLIGIIVETTYQTFQK